MEVMKSVVKMVLILVHLQLYLEVSQNEFCLIYVSRDLHTKFITIPYQFTQIIPIEKLTNHDAKRKELEICLLVSPHIYKKYCPLQKDYFVTDEQVILIL